MPARQDYRCYVERELTMNRKRSVGPAGPERLEIVLTSALSIPAGGSEQSQLGPQLTRRLAVTDLSGSARPA